MCNADNEQAGGRASQCNLYASINLSRGAVSIAVEKEESSCQSKEDQPIDAYDNRARDYSRAERRLRGKGGKTPSCALGNCLSLGLGLRATGSEGSLDRWSLHRRSLNRGLRVSRLRR